MISLPPFQYSVVVGLLLSDAWLICSSLRSKNSRLGFKQSLAHSEYLWLYLTYYLTIVLVTLI